MNDEEVKALARYLLDLLMRADPARRRVIVARMLAAYRSGGITVVYRATGEVVTLEESDVAIPEAFTKVQYFTS